LLCLSALELCLQKTLPLPPPSRWHGLAHPLNSARGGSLLGWSPSWPGSRHFIPSFSLLGLHLLESL
jgi:hypothetical protein